MRKAELLNFLSRDSFVGRQKAIFTKLNNYIELLGLLLVWFSIKKFKKVLKF